MINVSKLKKGIVLDHITAGHGIKVFLQLGLDKLSDVVVLMTNVESGKMGRKDLIKIETDLNIDVNVLGLIDPGITVSYVENGVCVNKHHVRLPEKVDGILTCKNPRCITQVENVGKIRFTLVDAAKKEYACEYCEARAHL